jgi:hypothetical protein
MISLIAIEVVPDNLIRENDLVSFLCGIAGRPIDGIIQEINIMGNLVNLQISCNVHETDHSTNVENVLENYTQGWII